MTRLRINLIIFFIYHLYFYILFISLKSNSYCHKNYATTFWVSNSRVRTKQAFFKWTTFTTHDLAYFFFTVDAARQKSPAVSRYFVRYFFKVCTFDGTTILTELLNITIIWLMRQIFISVVNYKKEQKVRDRNKLN